MAVQNDVAGFLEEVLKALHRAGALSPAEDSKVVDFQQPEEMEVIKVVFGGEFVRTK